MLFLFFAHCDGLILAVLIKKKYDEKKDAAISFSLSPTCAGLCIFYHEDDHIHDCLISWCDK